MVQCSVIVEDTPVIIDDTSTHYLMLMLLVWALEIIVCCLYRQDECFQVLFASQQVAMIAWTIC